MGLADEISKEKQKLEKIKKQQKYLYIPKKV